MTTEFHAPSPWPVIEQYASKQKSYVAVPFLGKGAASLLKIPRGSVLVTRCTPTAVRAGQVDPSEVLKFISRGVSVHNLEMLHAKVYVFGRRCFVGSANVSNSSMNLDEACIESTEPEMVRKARLFVEERCGDLLTPEYVKSLVKLYPTAGERVFGYNLNRHRHGHGKEGSMRVWVEPMSIAWWGAEIDEADRSASKSARAKLLAPSANRLDRAHVRCKPRYVPGDWIIWRYEKGRGYELEVPGRVLAVHEVPRRNGYLVYTEQPKNQRNISSTALKEKLGHIANEVRSGDTARLIRSGSSAKALVQLWKPFRVA